MAGKLTLMTVLLLHRMLLQTLFSSSVDDCLYTLWNYIILQPFNVLRASNNILHILQPGLTVR
jgi:hypothetical protein